MNITKYIKAGYNILAIDTHEIKRAVESITVEKETFNLFKWNLVQGITEIEGGEQYTDFNEFFSFALQQDKTVFVMENLNKFWEDETFIQMILNCLLLKKLEN